MLVLRVLLAALAVVAAVATALAVDDHLLLGSLRQGFAYGYRLPDLVLLAAAASVVWLCGYAAWRATRPGWDVALLLGPAVLAALVAEAVIPVPEDPDAYGYVIEVDDGRPYLLVDLLLTSAAVAAGLGIPTWALLRSRRGRPRPDPAPRP